MRRRLTITGRVGRVRVRVFLKTSSFVRYLPSRVVLLDSVTRTLFPLHNRSRSGARARLVAENASQNGPASSLGRRARGPADRPSLGALPPPRGHRRCDRRRSRRHARALLVPPLSRSWACPCGSARRTRCTASWRRPGRCATKAWSACCSARSACRRCRAEARSRQRSVVRVVRETKDDPSRVSRSRFFVLFSETRVRRKKKKPSSFRVSENRASCCRHPGVRLMSAPEVSRRLRKRPSARVAPGGARGGAAGGGSRLARGHERSRAREIRGVTGRG